MMKKKLLDGLSETEKVALKLGIRLELSRAVMGYNSEGIHDFAIFKRVPISTSLGDSELLNALWQVEAALNSAFMVGALVLARHEANQKDIQNENLV